MTHDALAVTRNDLEIGRLEKVPLDVEGGHARDIDGRHSRRSADWRDGLRSVCRWSSSRSRGGRHAPSPQIKSRRRRFSFGFRQPRGDCLSVVQGKAGNDIRMNLTLEIKRVIESNEELSLFVIDHQTNCFNTIYRMQDRYHLRSGRLVLHNYASGGSSRSPMPLR